MAKKLILNPCGVCGRSEKSHGIVNTASCSSFRVKEPRKPKSVGACQLCGSPVKVVGKTTKHYESVGVRAKTIEDCARVAEDNQDKEDAGIYTVGYNTACKSVALAIRRLASGEEKKS